jgi:hypothetical protein
MKQRQCNPSEEAFYMQCNQEIVNMKQNLIQSQVSTNISLQKHEGLAPFIQDCLDRKFEETDSQVLIDIPIDTDQTNLPQVEKIIEKLREIEASYEDGYEEAHKMVQFTDVRVSMKTSAISFY